MVIYKRSSVAARRTGALKNYRRRGTTSRSMVRTNATKRIWPYPSGMSPLWDPFPAKAKALLRYSQVVEINPATGIPSAQLFRANSIHDPDFTGIGHQPYGHDTYASIYNHYNVRSATITMTPTTSTNGIYGITLTDDSTVQADYNTVRELKSTRMSTNSISAGNPKTVTNYFNVNKNFDLPFQKATSASFGASPAEGMIFHCWFEGSSNTVDPQNTSFLFTISYVVDMWELKDLGQS